MNVEQSSLSGEPAKAAEPKYYSKNGEDYLLWRFFEGKTQGFYIDIGAFDGVHLSNSLTFEQMGWQGICVEPHPVIFPYCLKNRPGSLCLEQACVAPGAADTVPFYAEEMGLLSSTISSEDKFLDVKRRYGTRKLEFNGFRELQVPAVTVNRLLETHCPKQKIVDFISMDTEGNELDVLRGIDFHRYDIRVLVVEVNLEEEEKLLVDYLAENGGYQLARRVKVNRFFVKSEADAEKMKTIPIACTIQMQPHPLGSKFTRNKFMKERVIEASPGE